MAVLSFSLGLSACSPEPQHHATAPQTVTVSTEPGTPPKQWATDRMITPVAPYQGICLTDLYAPGADGNAAQFAAVGLVDPNTVVGIVTNTAGADQNSGRIGIRVVPADGVGPEIVRWNLSIDEANSFLQDLKICPKD